MGQYYKPLMIHSDGTKISAISHSFDNGLKLMEHSWIGSDFVNAVLHEIEDNPTRLAWLGDYSDSAVSDGCNLGGGFITDPGKFMEMYNAVWGENGEDVSNLSEDVPKFELDMSHADCYIVNVTKGCYIDMEHYVAKNAAKPRFADDLWCINPLPLLTALGNGMGGGDYRGSAGAEDIGSWAFDIIYATALKPGSMEEAEYFFRE